MGARLPLSYTYFWLWTEPVLLLLQIAVALEVHARMWTEHSAMVRPAKPLLFFALIIALVFALHLERAVDFSDFLRGSVSDSDSQQSEEQLISA
jgi:hypothetical protein